MAAPVVAGLAADLLQGHPTWTPDQVKGALLTTARPLPGSATTKEIVGDKANGAKSTANQGLTPAPLVSAGGSVDYTRSSWSRSSWSTAPSGLTAGWARSSWSCTCSLTSSGGIDPTRSSWSTSTWSTAWNL
jgi:subtilisin family serine protease